jgi:hypothetical protein
MPATAYIDVGEPEPISADGYIRESFRPAGGTGEWLRRCSFRVLRHPGLHDGDLEHRPRRDGRKWLHVSVAHPEKIPSWDTLKTVKNNLHRSEPCRAPVLPSETEYVNHSFCLHLFTCLDGNVTPDFTRGRGTL